MRILPRALLCACERPCVCLSSDFSVAVSSLPPTFTLKVDKTLVLSIVHQPQGIHLLGCSMRHSDHYTVWPLGSHLWVNKHLPSGQGGGRPCPVLRAPFPLGPVGPKVRQQEGKRAGEETHLVPESSRAWVRTCLGQKS